MIQGIGLSKRYDFGQNETVFEEIDFQFPQNSVSIIRGKSGSGKTTLLNILALLDSRFNGDLSVLNIGNLKKMSESKRSAFRRKYIGYVYQNFELLQELSVLENVMLPLRFQKQSKKKAQCQAEKWLEKVGLSEHKNKYPKMLSGGQQQRVGVARALISAPKIILADEPTGNLDIENTKIIMDLLVEHCQAEEKILIVVTHDDLSLGKYAANLSAAANQFYSFEDKKLRKFERDEYFRHYCNHY